MAKVEVSVETTASIDEKSEQSSQVDATMDSPVAAADTPAEGLLAELKACSRTGAIERAEDLFVLLKGTPDGESVEAFNFLIHACATKKDPDRAEHYMKEMEAAGVQPTPITYNSVINACAATGDGRRAQGWLMHMIDQGLQPTEVTYGTLCKVFARQGLVEQVKAIMEMLETGGGQLNEYFFASLISACGAAEPPDTKGAVRAFQDLVSRGMRPQSVKRALERVVGVRHTAQMFSNLGKASRAAKSPATPAPAKLAAPARPAGGGRKAAAAGDRARGGKAAQAKPKPAPPQQATNTQPRRPQRPPPAVGKGAATGHGKAPGTSPSRAEHSSAEAASLRPCSVTPTSAPSPDKKLPKPVPACHLGGGAGVAGALAFWSLAAQASEAGTGSCGYVPGAHFLACAAYPLGGPFPRMAVFA